jgi:hypothetical protein
MAWTTLLLLENWWLFKYLGQNHLGFFQMGKELLDAFKIVGCGNYCT